MQQQSGVDKHLSKILQKDKHYRGKVDDLFRAKADQSVSLKHQQRNIIINPSMFFNLLESNFLNATKKQSLELYYQLKMEVLGYLKYLLEDFPLNAKFIYQQAFLVVQEGGRVNFVAYLTKDIGQAFRYLQQNKENRQIYEQYIELCSSIFNLICMVCTLKTSELKQITNNLTQCYYQQQLSTQIIGHTFRLLDGGLQQRTITPYLYFIDNNKNDSVKVLFSNNRWPFSKGMTLFLWVNALKPSNCQLMWLKTEDGNELILKVEQSKVVIECTLRDNEEKHSIEVCEFPTNTVNMLGIELQPVSEGLFRSTSYLLNVNINGKEYNNLTASIPKFQSHEFVVQFSLLKNFIGNLYSIIITAKPELSSFEELSKFSQFGICSQALVWEFIDKKVLRLDSILCIFNAQRYYEGLLLNYVHEKNHGCYEGRISSVKYHKYDDKIIEVFMPFLYFMTLVKEKDDKWTELFDLILQYIISIIGKQKYETRSTLYLLYFLEINQYRISQSTLNLLYEYNEQYDNFYLDIVVKYLDVHVLTSKSLKINDSIEPFQNPVERTIFLFLLESEWKNTWNKLQGFEGWWSPLFFKAQKNQPYDPKLYLHDKDREGRVEWSVMNFVTPDYCKCLVEPEFVIPEYGNLDQFQKEYVRKECFRQQFKMELYKIKKGSVLVCDKKSNSSLEFIKSKLLKVADKGESAQKKQKQPSEFKQFEAPCLFIDILTIVVGVVRITKDGFLVFSGKHDTKRYDHMCVKAFKNEYFVYFSVALSDVHKIYRKRFNATPNALFVKLKDGREIMLHLYEKNVDVLLSVIGNSVDVKKESLSNYLNGEEPYKWIDKYMSNYEYLQWLNQIAGRSYTDITQYPVIPWTYVSDAVKVVEDDNFRDLTKNMGMQGDSDRIRYFVEKYENRNEQELFDEYHFGTHYSSSAIIFNFLIRIRPYSIGALTLQSGRFDVADRIFYSYCGSWNNAISSPTDLRELVPEAYTLPEMFINQNNYEYGTTQDKVVVDNVLLPKWAEQNPYKFVGEIRKQLESRYVSENINNWIDLIYGYKQRGKDAIENMNIFYPLTYENCIDLDKVEEWEEKESFQTQIAHFGQNPAQIIGNNPHPKRLASKAQWEDKLVSDGKQLVIQKCFLSKAPLSEERFLFQSVFEGRNAILAIKFVSQELFFVLRKHEYYLFQILNEKSNFLSRELQVSYELESVNASLNYKQLTTKVPVVALGGDVMLVGGFYHGNTQILFLKETKYNRVFRFPASTITALAYHQKFSHLFIGDAGGYLHIYKVSILSRQIQFTSVKNIKAHDSRVNDLVVTPNANLVTSCSEDGTLSLFNCYSGEIVRTIRHPTGLAITLAQITTSPLYSVVFYSKDNSTVYVYSINGQMLDQFCEKTGFVYNMAVLRSTDSTQSLVYLNGLRELYIWELPYMQLKRKVKVKRDDFRISCFECCFNSKIAVAGTQDGALQLVANPGAY